MCLPQSFIRVSDIRYSVTIKNKMNTASVEYYTVRTHVVQSSVFLNMFSKGFVVATTEHEDALRRDLSH